MSTSSDKAKRATVQIGTLSVDSFQLSDGSYRISPTQMAESVGKPEINARRFLDSRGIKALWSEAYTPDSIEVNSPEQGHSQIQIQHLRNAGLEPWQLPPSER
ncbi:hypothetical protein H6F75_27560 [Nodosilinea sp. FACHB-131]|uniref:hypothetical protein n=1 Tax=Cyanophyceae TaxID=3028117 RepID=UPI001683744C|nr:hypothetical protein [Nodosilinea sp. FACHB-131]MBD1877242.1 hypothetical protein [Nodosilinea sp. FACHB-131]